MTTPTLHRPSAELQLALTAALAGHHDAGQAGRERAARASRRLTTTLALLAGTVLSYDVLLIA